jgi:predicted dehydrogenase
MARVGIIGTGWGARVQVPAFREAGLDVVAIAGHNAERTRKIAGDLDVEPFDDWRSLIASNIDLVTIVTPRRNICRWRRRRSTPANTCSARNRRR